MNNKEALELINALSSSYSLNINDNAINFIISKITDGPPYYGQIIIKALRDEDTSKNFDLPLVKGIYNRMIKDDNNEIKHFHSRLNDCMTKQHRDISLQILQHLINNPLNENNLYYNHLTPPCNYEIFTSILSRLTYEGYITRDNNDNIKFLSPILRDWWAFKKGIRNRDRE
ncbi:hypothetical protein MCHI_002029 [Candidatus Magnetoovum chiemensis]|nr:hypothetical protein MCHI_002029 [Candidatus Magnetoovum chiemensis]